MGVTAQIFGLRSLTFAATIESFIIIRFHPDLFSNVFTLGPHLEVPLIVFLANYAFALLLWGFIYPRLFSPLKHMAGPRSFISAAQRSLVVIDKPPGALFQDLIKKYPDHDLLNLSAFDHQILITKPRMLADLLVTKAYDFIKPPRAASVLQLLLGDGLVMVEGDQHKVLRKHSIPAFSFRHIKELYPMMWDKSVLMCDKLWETLQAGEGEDAKIVDISSWTSRVTLDIIGVAGVGREFDTLNDTEDPLLEIYLKALIPTPENLTFAAASILFGVSFVKYIPWRVIQQFMSWAKSLRVICMSVVQEKKVAIANSKDDHFDLLSVLIKSGNFSDEQLRDQMLTFLAAGHETTSATLSWSCYLLAKDQKLQDKIREEVRQALPGGLKVENPADLVNILESLPYLNGIMNESLRLYPTIPMTMRVAIRDTSLAGQVIPKGVNIIIPVWQMNRSPDLWGSEADECHPERWITSGKPNSHGGANSNYDFMTFLSGPRSCIGQGFARAEMRCLLASMIHTFSWELATDEKKIPSGAIAVKAANGMSLKFKPLHV
ncbi:cytochrome P450 [Nemania sp. FL0031]|nr:cytochrome P450 [Nemania sp. FL0031]